MRYDILSPDGFSLHPTNSYTSKRKAFDAFYAWKKRFQKQGYYSFRGEKIDLEELDAYCTIVSMGPGEVLFTGKKTNLREAITKYSIKQYTASELAKQFVGDGKRPNIFFVTIGYGSFQPDGMEEIISLKHALQPVTILMNSKEQAEAMFNSIKLETVNEVTSRTISEVLIEDRITGTVKQRYYVEFIKESGKKFYVSTVI